jgi:hypothetical protein
MAALADRGETELVARKDATPRKACIRFAGWAAGWSAGGDRLSPDPWNGTSRRTRVSEALPTGGRTDLPQRGVVSLAPGGGETSLRLPGTLRRCSMKVRRRRLQDAATALR